ncbi:hypothetical protein EV421DRAFT_1906575 [Armillaria borealis]|uniref:Uncharacterized protein n=1 Tax=Armillaria borealis TaxID=47425 RepID=A0AA39J9I2_9AGAR|nr:hypothetical protein EV421DRAFT_1906575 [Armillaria borealis]
MTITNTKTMTAALSPSSSTQTFSSDSRHKATAVVISCSVIGSSLASIIVLALIFVLWRRKYRNGASNNTSGDNVPGMASVPNSIPILISSTHSGPIESTTSESSALTRRLSQSSRTAYEEEIEQLRQQIRYMEEEMELTYSGSARPSYRSSRRSVASDPFGTSSSPPPPLPSREIDLVFLVLSEMLLS